MGVQPQKNLLAMDRMVMKIANHKSSAVTTSPIRSSQMLFMSHSPKRRPSWLC